MVLAFGRLRVLGAARIPFCLAMAGLFIGASTGPSRAAAPKKKPVPNREAIYNSKADANADIQAALKTAKIDRKHVLIMYGGNWCSWCYKLHDLFKSDHDIALILRNEFVQVPVDVDTQQKVFDDYVKKSEQHGVPFLTVLDSDGKVLVNQETGALEKGKNHDPKKVKAFLEKWSAPVQNAEQVFADGVAQAKRESKRVFLHVGAPWCGWCRVLDRFLYENESLFAADFVNLKIDEDRMAEAKPLLKRLRPAKSSGIPWIAILDADGKTLITSDAPKTGNTGFPSAPEEISYFMDMLRKTSVHTSPEQLAAIERKLIEVRERRMHAPAIRTTTTSAKPST